MNMNKYINLDASGCVIGLSCDRYHSGNRRLAPSQSHVYQCQGCGQLCTHEQVVATMAGPVTGYTGGGGLARTA